MIDIDKLLDEERIGLKDCSPGQHKTTCPRCSHLRKKKRARCLSVFVDDRGIRANCWNCGHQVARYCNEDEVEAKMKAKQDDQKTGTQRKARGLAGGRAGDPERDSGREGRRVVGDQLGFSYIRNGECVFRKMRTQKAGGSKAFYAPSCFCGTGIVYWTQHQAHR